MKSNDDATTPPPLTADERLREAIIALAFVIPPVALGALLASAIVHRRWVLWCVGLACGALGFTLFAAGWYRPGWEWLWLAQKVGITTASSSPGNHGVFAAVLTELLWGPLLAALIPARTTAVLLPPAKEPRPRRAWFRSQSMQHPANGIRLGLDEVTGKPVDIRLDLLMRGCAVFGTTGSGKSTVLRQLALGALFAGASVVVIDGKGPALRLEMERIAHQRDVPFYALDPDDADTYTYDPLEGDSARISNKLLSALIPTASSDAAIYRALVQGAAPHILDGLRQVGRLNLRDLGRALADPAVLAQVARESGDIELRELLAQTGKGSLLSSALSGMSGRLRSISAGHFRSMLHGPGRPYSWNLADAPSLTYLSLPSLAAVADASVFCRVALSDIAQKVGSRQKALQGGATLPPLVLILDELTALSASDDEIEPRILAIMLQARQAETPFIVAGQNLPVKPQARQGIVGAGCLLALRLTASDAELMAAEFGTEPSETTTHQVEDGALSGSGTVTLGHAYRTNPQVFRGLRVGHGVLYIPPSAPRRIAIAEDSEPIPSLLRKLLRRAVCLRRQMAERAR